MRNRFYDLKKLIPDKLYLKLIYRKYMGKSLNLKNPKTFNEKIQWLKLYDRNPLYSKLVDKYRVREYIKNLLGEEYLIPLLGVWDKGEEIDFSKLPDKFVLKCTHNSGGVIVCKDKNKMNYTEVIKQLNNSLKRNYYYGTREYPYKNVIPKIIAEKYMEDDSGGLIDYKFFCFNGYVDNVMLCIDRQNNNPKFYFFNKNWKLLRINVRGKNAPTNFTLPKPECIDKMFEIASTLSKNIPFVRVDLYECKNKIYFGEMTFYPQSGLDNNLLEETDLYLGNLIKLSGGKVHEKYWIPNKQKRK
ncbi:ATP-grasp fold amidoligase family protein [Traorella massiliensis]|uniref:ATP-grasp fold amidoligase family protein n=1 Tax=Traorella massiliensis TaxID=1903263 RepID=UPI002356FD46|nr:ATP-grasp fold amidoligase family protein [Traorella massiliensis]